MYRLKIQEMPDVKMFGYMKQGTKWSHGECVTDAEILVFPIGGKAHFTFERETVYTVTRDQVLYIPSGTLRSARADPYFEYLFLHISPMEHCPVAPEEAEAAHRKMQVGNNGPRIFLLENTRAEVFFLDILTDIHRHRETLLHTLEQCQELASHLTSANKLLLNAQATVLLGKLAALTAHSLSGENEYPPLLKEVLKFVQLNYNRPITLRDAAAHFAVSESYIARLFRRHMNSTLSACVLQTKMEYAADLLAGGRMNVSEVASHLGYANVHYFSNCFSRYYGLSPTRYAAKSRG